MSLRWRLAASSSLIAVAMLLFLIGNNARLLSNAIEIQRQDRIVEASSLLNAHFADTLFQRDYTRTQEILDQLVLSGGSFVYLQVLDEQGRPFAQAGRVDENALAAVQFKPDRGEELFHGTLPLILGAQRVGTLRYGLSSAVLYKARAAVLRQSALIAVATLVLTIAALVLSGYWLTRDLARLVEATREIAGGHYDTRVDIATGDEVGQLGAYVNEMARAVSAHLRSLHESAETIRIVLASAQDAIIMVDYNGNIALWNAAAQMMFGYSDTEALGKELHALLAPVRFHEHYRRGFTNFAATGDGPAIGKTLELAALRKNGTEFPIELSLAAIKLKDKWHAVGIVRNISDRIRTQEALRTSEAKYREIFEKSFDGLFITSPEGKILDMNKKGVAMFGYDAKEEVLSLDLERDVYAYPPDRKRILSLVDAQGTAEYEVVVKKKNGGTMITYCALTAVKNEKGVVISYRGIIRDITEHKQVEAMRMQLAAIVQSSNDAVIGKDLDGVITSWNPGAEKIYGYRAEDAVGKGISMLAPQGRWNEFQELIERVKRGEAVSNFETERVRRDGARIDVSIDVSAINDATGDIVGVSTIERDVSEKRQAERALKKLNRALTALSRCNEVLIHATDELDLLKAICRIIVDIEGYRLAWVGYAEHDAGKSVKLLAHAGYEVGYMEHIDASWADSERGSGPLGIAIRSGELQVVQDVNSDPRFMPWRANAAKLGYNSVLVAPLLFDSTIFGALSIHAEEVNAFDTAEIALLGELASDMAFGIATLRIRAAHEQDAFRLLSGMEATITAMAATVEMRDQYTAGHQRRVAELAAAIAQEMGLTKDQLQAIRLAGVVHDLGKIQIPAEILSKPGKLSPIEYSMIKMHPEAGYEILKRVDFPWPIAEIVLQHHERLDGSGYPRGLKADQILLEARILAVADVVEAMASHRPYRPGLGIDAALAEIEKGKGTAYDIAAVDACERLFRERQYSFPA